MMSSDFPFSVELAYALWLEIEYQRLRRVSQCVRYMSRIEWSNSIVHDVAYKYAVVW